VIATRFPRLTPVVLAALAAGGCAGHTPYNPWIVPQARFFDQTRTIALAPVETPEKLKNPDPVRAAFDSLIVGALKSAGYAVIPASQSTPVWARLTDSAGGVFDPTTGHPDTVKARALHEEFLRELRTRFNADAVLYPAIVIVGATFDEQKASWDGTSQTIEGAGSFILRALAGVSRSGTTEALSLAVDIEDVGGSELFVNRGGIQVWSKPSRSGFHEVPRAELFVDESRNQKSIQIALGPVLARTAAATAKR
jgi:hypothetical protein